MASEKVSFGCTALMGTNKGGILKPDADGYYTVILGALDFENSYGAVYPLASAKEIFKETSGFIRRLRQGLCRGEYGHPKRLPGQEFEDYLRRIMTIEETRISHHISDAWIDYDSVKHGGRKIVTIWGKIRPEGPYGHCLKDSLDNPKANVAFSLRSLTLDEYVGGKLHKNIDQIACWDFVVEPGLSVATKYHNPALEEFYNHAVDVGLLSQMVNNHSSKLGLESADMLKGVLDRVKQCTVKNDARPPSDRW